MSREREILSYLVEIKEDVASIKQQLSDYPEVKEQLQKNTVAIAKAKSSVSTLRWLLGVVLLGAPSSIYAFMKIKSGS